MKTLNLFNKYFSLLEQDGVPPDPTETGTMPEQPATAVPEPSVQPLTSIAEQSYISLAARAFAFKPTDDQISQVNDALLEFGKTSPRTIRDMIESYLPDSSESIDSLLASTDEY
jgi:hypothetical protein